jgi:predicted N-acyltransferase
VTTVRVLASIQEAPRAAWDALVGADGSPFLEWDWLAALEEASTVTPETGWLPQHLTLWEDDALIGACPLYVKGHSMGEFVFDQSWAAAARRAGIDYYPKLLVAVPFTPVTGSRFLAAPGAHAVVAEALGAVLEDLCAQQGFSSAHVNFCQPEDAESLEARGWLRRTGYQYHWVNDGFRTFEDYLGSLRSKRRNQARRERRELDEQGVTIHALVGDDIPDELVGVMFRCYRTTIAQLAWGQQYLNQGFFRLVAERFRSRLCFIVARQGGRVIAGTFNVQKAGVLYGRYWGALESLRHLHFNVCYYAAIEHCIAQGLERFEPGAGGEFKHLRGFDARPTTSMHHLRDPRFRKAVADYLVRERAAVQTEIDWLDERTALRRDREPEIE